MGVLIDRYRGVQARAGDLSPLATRLKALFAEGNRAALLAGTDMQGRPVAPLKASTLAHRDGTGPPRVPHGEHSRMVTGYRVEINPAPGALEIAAGWPGLDWVRYFVTGTRKMPARDPSGFRPEDRTRALQLASDHVWGK